jgi:hypothetical protein
MILEIILFTLIFLIALFVAVFKIKNSKNIEKVDLLPNYAFILNPCRRQFTNGSGFGGWMEERINKDGTTTVKFLPLDNTQGKNEKQLPPQDVVVANENINRIPKGKLCNREVIILVGRSRTDYPEEIRDTPIGEFMTVKGQQAFLEKTFGKMIPAGDEAIAGEMPEFARGQIPTNLLSQLKEYNKQALDMAIQEKKTNPGG